MCSQFQLSEMNFLKTFWMIFNVLKLIYIFIVSIISRIRISCYATAGLFTTIGPILSPVSWLCFLCAPSQSGNFELFQHLQNAIIFLSPLKTSDKSITSLTSLSSLFMHWLIWVLLDILYKNGQLWEYHPINAFINILILRCNKGSAFSNFFSFQFFLINLVKWFLGVWGFAFADSTYRSTPPPPPPLLSLLDKSNDDQSWIYIFHA